MKTRKAKSKKCARRPRVLGSRLRSKEKAVPMPENGHSLEPANSRIWSDSCGERPLPSPARNELVLLRLKQARVRRVVFQNFALTHDPIFHFINPQQPKLSGLCALPLRTSVWGSSNKALCPPRAGSPVTLAPWSFQSPSPLKAQTVAAAPCAFLPPADCLRSSASPSVDFFLMSWSPSAREHES
jgi:hypothetical protein